MIQFRKKYYYSDNKTTKTCWIDWYKIFLFGRKNGRTNLHGLLFVGFVLFVLLLHGGNRHVVVHAFSYPSTTRTTRTRTGLQSFTNLYFSFQIGGTQTNDNDPWNNNHDNDDTEKSKKTNTDTHNNNNNNRRILDPDEIYKRYQKRQYRKRHGKQQRQFLSSTQQQQPPKKRIKQSPFRSTTTTTTRNSVINTITTTTKQQSSFVKDEIHYHRNMSLSQLLDQLDQWQIKYKPDATRNDLEQLFLLQAAKEQQHNSSDTNQRINPNNSLSKKNDMKKENEEKKNQYDDNDNIYPSKDNNTSSSSSSPTEYIPSIVVELQSQPSSPLSRNSKDIPTTTMIDDATYQQFIVPQPSSQSQSQSQQQQQSSKAKQRQKRIRWYHVGYHTQKKVSSTIPKMLKQKVQKTVLQPKKVWDNINDLQNMDDNKKKSKEEDGTQTQQGTNQYQSIHKKNSSIIDVQAISLEVIKEEGGKSSSSSSSSSSSENQSDQDQKGRKQEVVSSQPYNTSSSSSSNDSLEIMTFPLPQDQPSQSPLPSLRQRPRPRMINTSTSSTTTTSSSSSASKSIFPKSLLEMKSASIFADRINQNTKRRRRIYNPYNRNNPKNTEDMDAIDRIGQFLADSVDHLFWGQYDDDKSPPSRTSTKYQSSSSQQQQSSPNVSSTSSSSSSPHRKRKQHWKDRLEERFDSMMGIHKDGEVYNRWFQEEEENNNEGEEEKSKRGKNSSSSSRHPKKRYREKPFWEEEGSLIALLLGRTKHGQRLTWDKALIPRGGQGSLVTIFRTVMQTTLILASYIFRWASVRGAIPQPMVVLGVSAAGLCVRQHRLRAMLLALILLRTIGELVHGGLYGQDG